MTRYEQLKNEARRAEQRSDWARAIEFYKGAIRLEEERGSTSDVGVYNRIGDLHLRQGDTVSAVEYYEQAADRYAGHGLHTSAIALCNKILRIAPDRDEVYGRLARLHASTGLLAEARSAFLRFASRMRETDRLSEALEAVQDLVSLTGDEEIRTAFAEQLAGAGLDAQAVAQLRLVYQARVAGGRNVEDIREKIVALDPDADPAGDTEPPPPRATPTRDPLVSEVPVSSPVSAGPPAPAVEADALEWETDTPAPVSVELETGSVVDEEDLDPAETPAESDLSVESALTRFKSQVRDIVEETDHAIHYDLGIAYMGMELVDEAAAEFRLAMQSPALMESAHALLGECIRSRGASDTPNAPEPDLPHRDEPVLPLSEPSDFMMGQSVDLGVPAEVEEPAAPEPSFEAAPEAPAPDFAASSSADDGLADDDLAEMLFQARLAQHRTRAASDEGRVDHEAHLDLGRTYEGMGLVAEAAGDLVVAVAGPPVVRSEALDLLERVASSETLDAATLPEVLTALLAHGRRAEAMAAGRSFVERPGVGEAQRQTVLTLLSQEEAEAVPEEPAEDASPADDLPSPATEALAELGDILAELDEVAADALDLEAMESHLDPGASPDPRPASAEAPAVIDTPGSPVSGDDATALFGEAEGLRAAGRMDEAESHYYRALEIFEKERDAINAIRTVDRLLGLRPDDVVLHHQKNEFAIMTNDRQLLVSSYLDLAACLRRQSGFRTARTVYGRILDLDPQNAEARAGIAAVDADELARERQRQESPDRRSAKQDSSAAQNDRVEIVQATGEFDEMFEDLKTDEEQTTVEPGPPDYESHHELGIAFQQMEMWGEAAREFKLAVQGMTDPLPAYERLGECLLALRRYDDARRLLSVAATLPGGDEERAGVLFQLALAHLRSGDRESARTCLERVLEIHPARADAAHLLSTLPA